MCVCMCRVCPEGIHSCNMKNRDIYWRRYKVQEPLYIGQWCFSPFQNKHLGISQGSPIPISCPIIFSWISPTTCNLLHFKCDFSFGKARSRRVPNLGCRGAESPGWFEISPKSSAWDVMHERARCPGETAITSCPQLWPSESPE